MHLYLLKFEVINLGSCFWLHRFHFKTKQIYLAHPMTDRNVFVINTNFNKPIRILRLCKQF